MQHPIGCVSEEQKKKARENTMWYYQAIVNEIQKAITKHKTRPDLALQKIHKILGDE